MRKFQREIADFAEIKRIIESCRTVRLGLNGGDYPYVVPLSFGCSFEDGGAVIYFHCATEGKKLDLIAADNRVCLEWDNLNGYVNTGHSLTADYESVIAFGRAMRCEGEERVKGIERLLEHTGYTNFSAKECAAMPLVEVYKVVCERITGKRRFNK